MRLTSLVGKSKTMEMVLTGAPIKADEALKWGLVSQVHPHDKLLEEVMKTAKQIASQSQLAAAAAKRSVLASQDMGLQAALKSERNLFISLMSTHDKREGVDAFMAKRKPNFKNE